MTTIEFVVLALCLTLLLLGAFARRKIRRNREYDKYAKHFYNKISPLMADPDTPDEVLETIASLNRLITSKSAARNAVLAIADRMNGKAVISDKVQTRSARLQEFAVKRPELDKALTEAMVAALFAITSRSWIWGWIAKLQFRRMVEDDHSAAKPVVRRLVKQNRSRADNDDSTKRLVDKRLATS
ncbi:hypothetical protein [Roseibium sp.]|uniref:hypothetical protein n=1 Tax=Roseibium sp. TaxID=1936156 RepID=UPI003267EE7E